MVLKLIRIDYLVGLEYFRNTIWVIRNLQTAKRDNINIRRAKSAKTKYPISIPKQKITTLSNFVKL